MAKIPAAGGPGRRPLEAALLVVSITALAFNLRTAITSLPPVFPEFETRLGLSSATVTIAWMREAGDIDGFMGCFCADSQSIPASAEYKYSQAKHRTRKGATGPLRCGAVGGNVQLLSVRQPWAWAIARGRKPVENRDWAPSYRGQLAIYASMRVDLLAAEEPSLWFAGWDPDDPVAAIGGIVAVVTLADVCSAAMSDERCDCGEWARPNSHHWRLVDPRPLARPVVSIGHDGHMADVIPVRAIGQPADHASQAALWEPGPAVVAEVTAAAHLA